MILVFEHDHPATEKPTAHHEPDCRLSPRFVIRREQGAMRPTVSGESGAVEFEVFTVVKMTFLVEEIVN